jgi:hypothetical protein
VLKVPTERTLSPAPPSMRVLVTSTLLMVGEQRNGRASAATVHFSWSVESKVTAYLDHLSGRIASSLGRAAFTS